MPLSERAVARLEELLAEPGVVGYAAEPVVSAAGMPAVRVYLAEPRAVDEEIDGVPVETLVVGVPQLRRAVDAEVSPRTRVRPLVGGISVGGVAAGTLGYFVRRQDGLLCLLGSAHVLGPVGTHVLQPAPADGGGPADGVGTVVASVSDPAAGVVAACAALTVDASLAVNGIGAVRGTAAPQLGRRVFKSGRATGVTTGTVEATSVTVSIGGVTYAHQIAVRGVGKPFAAAGDSGSLVVDDAAKAVGLLLGGTAVVDWVNPIAAVLERLRATLAS